MALDEFTASTLPDARSYEDTHAIFIDVMGTRYPIFSDGQTWSPVSAKFYRPTVRTMCIGSSLTAKAFYLENTITQLRDDGWIHWANVYLDSPLRIVGLRAVSGNNSRQVLAQLRAALANRSVTPFEMIWGDSGAINDGIADAELGRVMTYEETRSNIDAIFGLCDTYGIRFVCLDVTPVISPNTFATAAYARQRARINTHMYRQASLSRNVTVVQASQAIVSPTNANGDAAANMLQAADGVHFTQKGARAIGVLAATTASTLAPSRLILPTSQSDIYNATDNPTMQGDNPLMQGTAGTLLAAGITGNVPSNCVLSGSASVIGTSALVARADGFGNDWVVTVTNTGGAGDFLVASNVFPNPPRANALGSRVSSVMRMAISGLANFQEARYNITTTIGGSTADQSTVGQQFNSLAAANYDWSDIPEHTWATQEKQLPSIGSMTALYVNNRFQWLGANGTGVLKVGRVALWSRG